MLEAADKQTDDVRELLHKTESDLDPRARKLVDICQTLNKDAKVSLAVDDQKALLRSGRSRFTLSTLPSSEFPATDAPSNELELKLQQTELKSLIDLTQFAMAQQDVRYYLNGMLWELKEGQLRVVATDGHRLAVA